MIKTVCGIELAGSEARFVILRGTKNAFEEAAPEFKCVSLRDPNSQEQVRSFVQTVHQHLKEQGVSICALNARNSKGNFAGGPISFKLEGLIQLAACQVTLVPLATLRAAQKRTSMPTDKVPKLKYLRVAAELAFHVLDAEE